MIADIFRLLIFCLGMFGVVCAMADSPNEEIFIRSKVLAVAIFAFCIAAYYLTEKLQNLKQDKKKGAIRYDR